MSDFEPERPLEKLWAGSFGDEYVDRNSAADEGRKQFWDERIADLRPASALEVGCNIGGNLRWVAEMVGANRVAGVDVNEKALATLRERVPGVDARFAAANRLPFDDGSFEIAFTVGVLIHLSDAQLPGAMDEIVRCSSRYVLCGEYYAAERTEVPYRDQPGALFKRDYGGLYRSRFPDLVLHSEGFLPRGVGSWDDVTWWVFEKRPAVD